MSDSQENEFKEDATTNNDRNTPQRSSSVTSSQRRRRLDSPYRRVSNSSDRVIDYNYLDSGERDPRPIQVVVLNRERKFDVDVEALGSVLLHDKIRDKPIVVVAISGDYRKGKSFLLNFFLRYLERKDKDNWMGSPDEPLTGFKWRGGCERETTGIWIWSEPFGARLPGGKEVGIILMDTQGTFDSDFKFSDNAIIFALSAMTSSVLIYNLMHNLQEDNLNVLEFFVDYGRLALEATKEKPFQKLVFLIRDWSYPYDYQYGINGGKRFLQKKLAVKNEQPTQLKRVRRHIENCFQELCCFLMPHPGILAATNPEFRGTLSSLETSFVENLKEFVELILKEENLVIKKIGGLDVTGVQLMEYFKVYTNVFQQDIMPEPKTMLEATAEANNLAAVAAAKTYYIEHMEGLVGGNRPFIYPATLEYRHGQVVFDAKKVFESTRKMGGDEYSSVYLKKLEQEIKVLFEHYAAHNRSKSFYGLLGTPVTLFFLALICLASTRIFELIHLTFIAYLLTCISTALFATSGIYVVLKARGQNEELLRIIDVQTEKVLNILYALGNGTFFA